MKRTMSPSNEINAQCVKCARCASAPRSLRSAISYGAFALVASLLACSAGTGVRASMSTSVNMNFLGSEGTEVAIATTPSPDLKCIAMELHSQLRRYVMDDAQQVLLNLTLANSDRVSHRLTNAVFIRFLKVVAGYLDVVSVHYPDTLDAFRVDDILGSRDSNIPTYMVNLEVWVPFGIAYYDKSRAENLGSHGILGRFGWFVSERTTDTGLITDHWRSYLMEDVTKLFALTRQEMEIIQTNFTVNSSSGNHYCENESVFDISTNRNVSCTNGVFIPPRCEKNPKCATLFASEIGYSSFLMQQILDQELLVNVAWIGPNLTPEFIQHFRNDSSKVLFFSWYPSPVTIDDGFISISFPACSEESHYNYRDKDRYNCKYELQTLEKLAWEKLKSLGTVAFETIQRFGLTDQDYHELLSEYNHRTKYMVNNPLDLVVNRPPGWDDQLIEDIACKWLLYKTNEERGLYQWKPLAFNLKKVLWIGGIFPMNDDDETFSSSTLSRAAELASIDINKDDSLLTDYQLNVLLTDGKCQSAHVLYRFIKFMYSNNYDRKNMAGILGPGCSDTVEPLVGIAKLFNTVIVSYSAEGAIFNDKGKYPYFFRTIPENRIYSYVYVELFRNLNWKQVASLTEDGYKYSDYLNLLEHLAKEEGVFVYNKKFPRELRNEMGTYLETLREQNYRIIIGDFYAGMGREVMCEAYRMKMTAKYGYIWFLPRWYPEDWYEIKTRQSSKTIPVSCTTDEMLQAIDGHLSLGYAYYADDDAKIHNGEKVSHWKNRYLTKYINNTLADYAGYTYDATWTYAFALDKLLKEDITHSANLQSDKTNQRFIELLRKTDFHGVSGHIRFVEGASRQTNVLVMQFSSTGPRPQYSTVGTFHPNKNDSNVSVGGNLTLDRTKFVWLTSDGKQPTDGKPPAVTCALETFSKILNQPCEITIVITMLIFFFIFAALVIVLFIVYRTKYQKVPAHSQMNILNKFSAWEIPRERVVINRILGQGAFGTVYGGECQITEHAQWTNVAVKTLKVGSKSADMLDFLTEAEHMKEFDHENIIKLIGVCTTAEPIYMIMEFMLYGDLKTYLLSRRTLVTECAIYSDENEVSSRRLTSMAWDVVKGLEYLAINKYVHRDVACRNCLISEDRVVKLSDFGMTREVFESNYYRFSRKGMLPVRWLAPESLEDGIYTTMSDIWSYGVLLYEIVTFGNTPFQNLTNDQVMKHVKEGNTIQIPDGVRIELAYLMDGCMKQKPEDRLTFAEITEIYNDFPRLITPCLEDPQTTAVPEELGNTQADVDFERPCLPCGQPFDSIQMQALPQPFQIALPPAPVFSSNNSRTPRENGNCTHSRDQQEQNDPLMGVLSGEYITRYACLQMNRSPSGTEVECGSPGLPAGV